MEEERRGREKGGGREVPYFCPPTFNILLLLMCNPNLQKPRREIFIILGSEIASLSSR